MHDFLGILCVVLPMILSLVVIMKSSFFMIDKKNIYMFLPFFMFGIVFITSAVFSYYDVFFEASILHRTLRIMSYGTMFYVLWRRYS